MTMNETIEALSADAKSALLAAPNGGKIGAVIDPMTVRAGITLELKAAGVTGRSNGLTIRGSAVAMKLKRIQEDELFPL